MVPPRLRNALQRLALVRCAAGVLSVLLFAAPSLAHEGSRLKIDEKIHAIHRRDVSGRTIRINEPGKKGYVLYFFATWAKITLKSLEQLDKLSDKYRAFGIEFIGVHIGPIRNPAFDPNNILFGDYNRFKDPSGEVRGKDGNRYRIEYTGKVDRYSMRFPCIEDRNQSLARAYKLNGPIPMTFVTDGYGRVKFLHYGTLLEGQPPIGLLEQAILSLGSGN